MLVGPSRMVGHDGATCRQCEHRPYTLLKSLWCEYLIIPGLPAAIANLMGTSSGDYVSVKKCQYSGVNIATSACRRQVTRSGYRGSGEGQAPGVKQVNSKSQRKTSTTYADSLG